MDQPTDLPVAELGFVSNGLLRAGIETDADGLLAASETARGLLIRVCGEKAVLFPSGDRMTALAPADRVALGPPRERVVLGWREGIPVTAVLHDVEAAEHATAEPGVLAVDLRSIAVQGLVPPDELGALAQGKAILSWHSRHRFCAQCGAPTASASGGLRRDCSACGAQHFPRTDPVAIMLVVRDESCLLGRQARFVPNSYSCLAGFISPGETIEDAVRREVLEEAGVQVGRVRYLASQPWPFPSSLMIGCLGEALTPVITLDRQELEDGRWFSRDEVRAMLHQRHPAGLITPPPMAIANHLMRAWVEGRAELHPPLSSS